MTLLPNEVFIPGRFPTEEQNAYADRGAPQRNLEKAMARGFVPLIYGAYGVGKSSLVMYCAREAKGKNNLVYVENAYKKSMSDVLAQVLEHLGYEITVGSVASSARGGQGSLQSGVEGGVLGAFMARFAARISRSWKNESVVHKELAVSTPSDSRVIDLCEDQGIVLVIDELHRASKEFTADLAAFVKSFSNRGCRAFKLCLLGTENDPNRLVALDQGVARSLEEISLGSLSNSEAESIIATGMKALGLSIDQSVVDRCVFSSVGSPFLVQYLCLEMSEAARHHGRAHVDGGLLDAAIKEYARRKAQQFIRGYRSAIETTGTRRYRKQILDAMAAMEDDYVTMESLILSVSKSLGDSVPATALSGPLRDLKSAQYGKVLRDVERPGGGGRVYNYSAFSEPGMKAIVRMIARIGLDPTSDD